MAKDANASWKIAVLWMFKAAYMRIMPDRMVQVPNVRAESGVTDEEDRE